jgi:hypothetical protein
MSKNISDGVVHKIPQDLRELLTSDQKALALWEDITPLARNEWICWVENAKLLETRARRVGRVRSELKEGMRRPCCWMGCIHRTDKKVSPSVENLLLNRSVRA